MSRTTTTKADVLRCLDPHIPIPGKTNRVNHAGCPAGEDTRERLYVTAKLVPKNLMVWYCHNCGEGGAFKHHQHSSHHTLSVGMALSPSDLRRVVHKWGGGVSMDDAPPVVSKWLTGVCPTILPFLKWHPMDYQVMFPIWENWCPSNEFKEDDEFWSPSALLLRSFEAYGAKYLTMKGPLFEGKSLGMRVSTPDDRTIPMSTRHVLVCEDWLSAVSAYKNGPVTMDTYAMFGSHLGIDQIAKLHKVDGYNRMLVWLDNDNEHVVESARLITQRAKLVGFKDVRIEKRLSDPKHHPDVTNERDFEDYDVA